MLLHIAPRDGMAVKSFQCIHWYS